MAEISKIKFSSDLQKALFPDNSFYKNSMKEDGIEVGVSSVEIPIAGNIAAASEGEPTSLPLQVSLKEDTKKTYDVKLLYAGPVLITRESEIVTSYPKFQETVNQFAGVINTKAADYAANAWGPTLLANMVLSTGANRAVSLVGATGNRKKFTKADIISVKMKLSKMNLILPGSLFGLVTPDQYQDLLEIAEFVDYDKTGNQSRLAEGYVGKILGFEIAMRWNDVLGSIGLHYSNAASPPIKKANGVVAATDRPAGLFWHSAYVRHAEGNAHTSINRDKAEYLGGSIMSSMVRFGATSSRLDEKGVVALIEDTGA